MATIELNGLGKEFDGIQALCGVDLAVERGEVFGFLGPNGAGKSTIISILLDFVRPTAGSATVLGHDTQAESKAVRERTGVMPEGYQVYKRLTGREHIEFVIDSEDPPDDPVDVLERVGIGDAADRPAGDYSKGMKQRLMLGMALVGDPDVLILDEPSTGLDPAGVREIRSIVREESADGMTVLFSSHSLSQVQAVCDRIGLLHDGELVAVDTAEGLRQGAGAEPTLRIEVDGVTKDDLAAVRALECVERASMADGQAVERDGPVGPDGHQAVIIGVDDNAKFRVLETLEDRGVRVVDCETTEASLEELFMAYTEGER